MLHLRNFRVRIGSCRIELTLGLARLLLAYLESRRVFGSLLLGFAWFLIADLGFRKVLLPYFGSRKAFGSLYWVSHGFG